LDVLLAQGGLRKEGRDTVALAAVAKSLRRVLPAQIRSRHEVSFCARAPVDVWCCRCLPGGPHPWDGALALCSQVTEDLLCLALKRCTASKLLRADEPSLFASAESAVGVVGGANESSVSRVSMRGLAACVRASSLVRAQEEDPVATRDDDNAVKAMVTRAVYAAMVLETIAARFVCAS